MLWAQNQCQLLSNVGAALPLKRAYLCSVNLVETSMHNCVGLVTREGRGGKMAEKKRLRRIRWRKQREGGIEESREGDNDGGREGLE
jgi:hypothetical protein